MSTRIDDFELSTEHIGKLLDLGIRPIKTREPKSGDMVASFFLIPTKHFKFNELLKGNWDGSYIPLIVYRTAQAAILVPAGDEKDWLRLANHIAAIIKMDTEVRPD